MDRNHDETTGQRSGANEVFCELHDSDILLGELKGGQR